MDQTTAEASLALWVAANDAIAVGKAYTIGNRQLTRADAQEVRDQLTYWQRIVNQFTSTAAGVKNPGIRVSKWS